MGLIEYINKCIFNLWRHDCPGCPMGKPIILLYWIMSISISISISILSCAFVIQIIQWINQRFTYGGYVFNGVIIYKKYTFDKGDCTGVLVKVKNLDSVYVEMQVDVKKGIYYLIGDRVKYQQRIGRLFNNVVKYELL